MKDYIDSGLTGLRGFYEVINTKQKAVLLIVVWLLCGTTFVGHRFANVETIERLMITYTKCVSEIELSKKDSAKKEVKADQIAQLN